MFFITPWGDFLWLTRHKKNQAPGGMHEEPEAGDSLVVVSQSWSHQMHPDPTGVKAHAGAGFLPEIPADGGGTLVHRISAQTSRSIRS